MRARRRDGALCEDALEVCAVQRQHADCQCVSYPVIQCVSETVSSESVSQCASKSKSESESKNRKRRASQKKTNRMKINHKAKGSQGTSIV